MFNLHWKLEKFIELLGASISTYKCMKLFQLVPVLTYIVCVAVSYESAHWSLWVSCFLTSVPIICNIYLWFLECSWIFLNIPSSFPLCTSIHNSLNLTHLKKCSVLSTNLFLGFKYCQKWASKSTIELNNFFNAITFFPSKKWSRITFPA